MLAISKPPVGRQTRSASCLISRCLRTPIPTCLARQHLLHRPACTPEQKPSLIAAACFAQQRQQARRSLAVHSQSPSATPQPSAGKSKGPDGSWVLVAAAMFATAIGAAYLTSEPGAVLKEYLVNGPLGRSGFLAAFSLIFLSEIGDKTFFIAALLAMKVGKWISFLGSVVALSAMTVVSVGIGAVFSRVPDALKSSIPVGEMAGVALLVFFGIKTLREALATEDEGSIADGELVEAKSALTEAESSGRVQGATPLQSFVEVATLIFLAEWGDRSMLATIALGAAQNPVGVAVGAVLGHAIATGIAVLGGAFASKYVSERTISIISGVLFLVFAAATAYGML